MLAEHGDIMLQATRIKYALHAHTQRSMDLHRYLFATKIYVAPLTLLPRFILTTARRTRVYTSGEGGVKHIAPRLAALSSLDEPVRSGGQGLSSVNESRRPQVQTHPLSCGKRGPPGADPDFSEGRGHYGCMTDECTFAHAQTIAQRASCCARD